MHEAALMLQNRGTQHSIIGKGHKAGSFHTEEAKERIDYTFLNLLYKRYTLHVISNLVVNPSSIKQSKTSNIYQLNLSRELQKVT